MGPVLGGETDVYLYDSVSRLLGTDFYVPKVPLVFADGFESGDTSAWTETAGFGSGGTSAWSGSQAAGGLSDVFTRQLFDYDRFGNLVLVNTDDVVETFSVDESTNRLASPAVYDMAGNLLSAVDASGATVTFTYDALNRLVRRQRAGDSSVWIFAYTADDERIGTIELSSGELRWTLRDSAGMLLREFEYDQSANVYPVRDQIYRGTSLLATVSQDPDGVFGEVAHYSLDHLGSPRLITTATGGVRSRHKYYPFGEEATLANQDGHPMKFTGHERDFFNPGESDDLDYMHARYCDPFKGRFLTTDPVGGQPELPQSWNRYAYVLNSPINYTDPSGNFPFLAILGAAWIAAEAAGTVADVVEVIDVWTDDSASLGDRLWITGAASLGMALPGSGYSKIDDALEIADDVVDGAKAVSGRGTQASRALMAPVKFQRHHIFPQKFRDFFSARGIDIDKHTVELSQERHLSSVHGRGDATTPGRFNQRWEDFIETNPNATAREVYQFGGTLMDDFGLSNLPVVPYR